jgi:hypothetical protein
MKALLSLMGHIELLFLVQYCTVLPHVSPVLYEEVTHILPFSAIKG